MQTIRLSILALTLLTACGVGPTGGSGWTPIKPSEVKPLPEGDVCEPVNLEAGVSVTLLDGKLEASSECGGGSTCVSADDCIVEYKLPARKYRSSGFVDAVRGMVFMSEYTWLLATQNNEGKYRRLYLCARPPAEERTFMVTMKPGAQIGRAGFIPATPTIEDCKGY